LKEEFDIAVLGGGPAGYPAAIRAAQKGARVCVIEKDVLGGTCLNRGCIPTKVLHARAHLIESLKGASISGIKTGSIEIDYSILSSFKTKVVSDLVKGVEILFKSRKIRLIRGHGRLKGDGVIDVEGFGEVKASRIIVATGSSEMLIPGLEFDGQVVLSSTDLLKLDSLPESLLIVGGGVIGCEFASIFNAFGVDVTIIEMLPKLIATEDTQISRAIQTYMKKRGIKVLLGEKVVSIEKDSTGAVVKLESGEQISCEKVLVSVGRIPNISDAGLEDVGVRVERGAVVTDRRMRTSIEGIFAAGDVTGHYLLAHVATREGIVSAENATGSDAEIDYRAVPVTIYTFPEISRVGISEDEAISRGVDVKTGRFPFAANGKAKGLGEIEGFVKWVARKEDGRILGVHVIGPQATELISSGVVAIQNELTIAEYISSIFPHPTLSESVHEAAEAVLGRAIHLK